MYIRYIFSVIIGLIFNLINYFLAPLVVLFAKDGWLPKYLNWFQTPDNSLDGDEGWKQHRPFKIENRAWKKYINRIFWLYRNPMYNFDINILGIKIEKLSQIKIIGNINVSNRPLKEGLVRRYLIQPDGKKYFQFYYVKAWSSKRCIRINLGWKLWGNNMPGDRVQLVFSPSPFMGYSRE